MSVLWPQDTFKAIDSTIEHCLQAGVPLVWIVAPRRRTVTAYARDASPILYNADQELTGDPHLPGFRVPVVRLFE